MAAAAPGGATTRGPWWRWTTLERVPWGLVHGLTLVAGAGVLLVANRNQWFAGDEWNFIVNRSPHGATLGLFTPHNEHWSTIPVLVYQALLATVGLRSYLPYVSVVIALHLALTHLLWRASLRAGASPPLATGLATVFVVLGAGAENLLWAFQVGFVGAVAFGWAAVLLHDHDGSFARRDLGGWAASVAALMCAGQGVVMVGMATLTVALRRRRLRDTVLTGAVPGLVFATWWLVAGRGASGTDESTDGAVWRIPEFVWTGLTHTAETVTGVPGAGAVLVLALVVWSARHTDLAGGRSSAAFAGGIGALVTYLVIAAGRVGMGLEAATASRYLYLAAALLLPLVALALSRSFPRRESTQLVLLGLCGLLAVHNVGLLRERTSEEMGDEQPFAGTVVAAAGIVAEGEEMLSERLDPRRNPDLTVDALARIDEHGWLPDVTPTAREELTAMVQLQTTLQPANGGLGTVELVGEGVELAPVTSDLGPSCIEARPVAADAAVVLRGPGEIWRVRMQGPGEERIGVRMVSLDDARVMSRRKRFELPESGIGDIVSSADDHPVQVTLPDGAPTTFCGVVAVPAPAG